MFLWERLSMLLWMPLWLHCECFCQCFYGCSVVYVYNARSYEWEWRNELPCSESTLKAHIEHPPAVKAHIECPPQWKHTLNTRPPWEHTTAVKAHIEPLCECFCECRCECLGECFSNSTYFSNGFWKIPFVSFGFLKNSSARARIANTHTNTNAETW